MTFLLRLPCNNRLKSWFYADVVYERSALSNQSRSMRFSIVNSCISSSSKQELFESFTKYVTTVTKHLLEPISQIMSIKPENERVILIKHKLISIGKLYWQISVAENGFWNTIMVFCIRQITAMNNIVAKFDKGRRDNHVSCVTKLKNVKLKLIIYEARQMHNIHC